MSEGEVKQEGEEPERRRRRINSERNRKQADKVV